MVSKVITAVAEGVAKAGPETPKSGFKAYHGSPYKFEEFDFSAIGTGEGAQAYGYGLYFAEAEDVARGYKEALTNPRIEVEGKPADLIYTALKYESAFQISMKSLLMTIRLLNSKKGIYLPSPLGSAKRLVTH